MRYIKKVVKIVLIFFIVIIMIPTVYFGFHLLVDAKLTVTSYTLDTKKISAPIRIVQLTDLHNAEFGDENENLIKLVEEQNPDIIVMTGDMVNEDVEDTSVVEELVCNLRKIAPVYYGYGNHEFSWDEAWGEKKNTSIKEIITESGAEVLEESYQDIVVNGIPIRIGGYGDYYRNPVMKTNDKEEWQRLKLFFDDFESAESYKILLNHIPTSWLEWNGINWDYNNGSDSTLYDSLGIAIDGFNVDLVFSGHYHGGQWVLPFVGGVYTPEGGFHPEYTKGIFEGTKATCVLSSGLGNEYGYIPRINNPPEIVVVDLLPDSAG